MLLEEEISVADEGVVHPFHPERFPIILAGLPELRGAVARTGCDADCFEIAGVDTLPVERGGDVAGIVCGCGVGADIPTCFRLAAGEETGEVRAHRRRH